MPLERSNTEWLDELVSESHDQALDDLYRILLNGLQYSIGSRGDVSPELLHDFTQDALIKILDKLDTFRGESRFTTWAQKIAIHVALSELRRLRWKDVSLDEILEDQESRWIYSKLTDETSLPEKETLRQLFLREIEQAIRNELSERQRTALVAVVIEGIPLQEVAYKMNTNRNALYKLIHDARQKLKRHLISKGFSPQEIMNEFSR